MKNPLNLKYNNLFYSNQQSYKLNLYKIFNLSLMLIIKINIIKHNNILKLKELFNKTTKFKKFNNNYLYIHIYASFINQYYYKILEWYNNKDVKF